MFTFGSSIGFFFGNVLFNNKNSSLSQKISFIHLY